MGHGISEISHLLDEGGNLRGVWGAKCIFYYIEWLFVNNEDNVGYLQITTLQFYYF